MHSSKSLSSFDSASSTESLCDGVVGGGGDCATTSASASALNGLDELAISGRASPLPAQPAASTHTSSITLSNSNTSTNSIQPKRNAASMDVNGEQQHQQQQQQHSSRLLRASDACDSTTTTATTTTNTSVTTTSTSTTRLAHKIAHWPRRLKHKLNLSTWSSSSSTTASLSNVSAAAAATTTTSKTPTSAAAEATGTISSPAASAVAAEAAAALVASADLLYERVSKLIDKCSNALTYIRRIVDKQQRPPHPLPAASPSQWPHHHHHHQQQQQQADMLLLANSGTALIESIIDVYNQLDVVLLSVSSSNSSSSRGNTDRGGVFRASLHDLTSFGGGGDSATAAGALGVELAEREIAASRARLNASLAQLIGYCDECCSFVHDEKGSGGVDEHPAASSSVLGDRSAQLSHELNQLVVKLKRVVFMTAVKCHALAALQQQQQQQQTPPPPQVSTTTPRSSSMQRGAIDTSTPHQQRSAASKPATAATKNTNNNNINVKRLSSVSLTDLERIAMMNGDEETVTQIDNGGGVGVGAARARLTSERCKRLLARFKSFANRLQQQQQLELQLQQHHNNNNNNSTHSSSSTQESSTSAASPLAVTI